jgi:hypothetical protein
MRAWISATCECDLSNFHQIGPGSGLAADQILSLHRHDPVGDAMRETRAARGWLPSLAHDAKVASRAAFM